MNTGPQPGTTPLELLENKEIFKPSIISKWFNPVTAGAIAFVAVILGNYVSRRPIMSGIQKHIGLTAAAFFIAKYFDEKQAVRLAIRDASFRHYVELHPEDFPPLERKQYKDILQSWNPIRN